MIYAPVIIPTLCRYELFKQCLDSLNANHNAENTEVYISVDAPVKEEHIEGHDKICDYLDKTTFNFKQIHVFKQTENLGIRGRKGHYSNIGFLMNFVSSKYDRWIFSEDDNVFSPNFLDFINLGLEKFKDDKSVLAICGYRFFYNLRFSNNNFFRQQIDFNAWGYGIWKDRWLDVRRRDNTYLRKIVFSPIKTIKVWRKSTLRMTQLIYFSYKKHFKNGDNFYSLYMINENMYQIMPTVSKVRNLGWDNTGIHCNGFDGEVVRKHVSQDIDSRTMLDEYKGTGFEYIKENERIIVKSDFLEASFLKCLLKYIVRLVLFWK